MSVLQKLTTLVHRIVQPASAHCDTEEGPVVTAGRRALAAGNVNIALMWVRAEDEAEVRAAFDAAQHASTPEVERAYLEVLVRLHRASEGHGYDGIKPAGTPLPPVVTAGDKALETGDVRVVLPLVEGDEREAVTLRFATMLALRDHDVDDLATARKFVAAYVDFIHYALHHRLGTGQVAAHQH